MGRLMREEQGKEVRKSRVHGGEGWEKTEKVGGKGLVTSLFDSTCVSPVSHVRHQNVIWRDLVAVNCQSSRNAHLSSAFWRILSSDGVYLWVWTMSSVSAALSRTSFLLIPLRLLHHCSEADRGEGTQACSGGPGLSSSPFWGFYLPAPLLSLATTQRPGLQLRVPLVRTCRLALAGNVSCKQ